jgi:hypothetical protein
MRVTKFLIGKSWYPFNAFYGRFANKTDYYKYKENRK